MNEPDVNIIQVKLYQNIRKIKSNALLSISDRDKNLKSIKDKDHVLGKKFVELYMEKIIQD